MSLLAPRRPKNQLQKTQFDQGKSITLPAPTGGINLRDDIGDMKPNEARVLENWLPTTGQVSLRPGKTHFASGMGLGEVKTLASFVGYSASKLLAGANGKIYDATSVTFGATGNDTYTKVLLKMDGVDASTTFTDSNAGGAAHAWTAAGNAQIDTAASKFGGASGLFDGAGDYIVTGDHADFTLGSGDFTIDCWFFCNAAAGTDRALAGHMSATASNANRSWYLGRTSDIMHFSAWIGGAELVTLSTTAQFTDAINTGWHHLAVTRSGNVYRLFIDGVLASSQTMAGTIQDSAHSPTVGATGDSGYNPFWLGWIDEFRLSGGIARWTANFTPPASYYAPPELASGFTQDRWQTAVYSDRLFFVNGADTPQVYNGSTVAAIAWSGLGLTNTNLINVALVRNRLWFCESNQAWVWYGAIGQITAASALTKFDVSQVAGGGFCMAVASWSRDSGNGADDLTVFIMSTGELIIYQGDPATTFTLIGKFHAAPPVGRQCSFSVGGELVIITTQGLLPLSTAIGGTVTGQDIAAIDPWGKAAPGIAADAAMDATNAGWNGLFDRGLVYINVPQEPGSLSKQWILNTRNGAWTTYTGLNGSSWCVHNGSLYIGMMTGGVVMTHAGASDNGTAITAAANCAFVYAAKNRATNLFTSIRPKIKAVGAVSGRVGVDVDFNIRALTSASVTLAGSSGSSAWDTSAWETTSWGSDPDTVQLWYSVNGLGKAVSVRLTAVASSEDVQWFATDVLYKAGGIR